MWLRTLYYLKKSFDTLHLPEDELEGFQERRIEEMLDASASTSFYSERLPEDPGMDDLDALPLLRKEEIPGDGIGEASGPGGASSIQSAGRYGSPDRIEFTAQADDWISAVYARTLYLQGYRPPSKIVQYGRSTEERSLYGRYLIPKKYVGIEESLPRHLEILDRDDPEVLHYYPQTMLAVAKKFREADEQHFDPALILTYGGNLTPETRNFLSETFDAEIQDQYGTAEFGTVGWECPEGGYHIAEDSVYPEVLDSNGKEAGSGEAGRLVLTGLVNRATPLVRYDTGDIVEKARDGCRCDTSFARMAKIRGRSRQVIKNSEGRDIYPDEVIDAVAPEEEILFFQLVARDRDFELRYVPASTDGRALVEEVADRLRSGLSLEPLETERVDTIPQSEGGKLSVIDNQQEEVR